MASLQSKLWEFFLKPLYSRKAKFNDELNIKLARLIVADSPPATILRNNKVETKQIAGKNVFTITPKKLRNNKVIFYLHGGAYIAGITWAHWRFIRKLVGKAKLKTVLIDYPVAPENWFVDAIDMVLKSYKDTLKDHTPDHIVFMGDSAGGGMALAIAQELFHRKLPQPGKIILLCPWLDVTLSNPCIESFQKKDSLLSRKALISAGRFYARETNRKNPLISPIYGTFDGLAPIHLFAGTHDMLTADARKLNERLKNNDSRFYYYEFDQMFHVWMLFPIPEAEKTIRMVSEILS